MTTFVLSVSYECSRAAFVVLSVEDALLFKTNPIMLVV